MESLATVLRRVPMFADLPPGSFAKIIADLREERHPAGTVLCREGDAARDLYIIKSGECEVFVNQDGNQRELVAVNTAHQWFGERALFSDRPRSATVVARTAVELWRLTKDKFDALIEENPWLILHFTQVIGDRLYETNQQLSKIQAAFNLQMEAQFRAQPPAHQEFLTRTAILAILEPPIVAGLLGQDGNTGILEDLETSGLFLTRRDGGAAYPDAIRDFLLGRLTVALGTAGVQDLHRRAAQLYERAGRPEQAIGHYLDAGDTRTAAQLLACHVDHFIEQGRAELLHGWLDRLSEAVIHDVVPAVRARIERALHLQGGAAAAQLLSAAAAPLPGRLTWLGAVLGTAAGLGIWNAPPPDGLTTEGMRMLALLAWAVVFWAFDVLPDYVVGLGMIIGWILFAIVPSPVAVSGFVTSPFFLIVGVLGIAASLQSSGLLFRLALQILRRFPLTYRGQALGLALSGTAITLCIPDVTSGVAVAAPIILALSDSLGYGRRSNGSAGLAMAAVLGFGQMSPFFLTGAAENLLAWGLLPEAVRMQISWGVWLQAAWPLALVTFVAGFVTTMLLFPPEFQPTISRGLIETQIEALGRPSHAEVVNGAVLIGAVVGWITAPYHGVDVAWVAMGGMALLLAANLLDRITFRAGIYWDFVFYLVAVLSLTGVVQHLGVDAWLVHRLAPLVEPLTASPGVFLLVVAVAVFAARFILPSFPLVSLLVVTLVPIGAKAGIHPLALSLVICTAVTVWFLPYQSPYYLALYVGTKERAFSHRQVRLLAWSYGLIYLLAILAVIPYWRLLGLLP